MKTLFNTANIIKKLVDHYGLPAFLFEPNGHDSFVVAGNKNIVLIPYSQYPSIPQLQASARNMYLFEDLWHTRQEILASQISRHAGYHEKINARAGTCMPIEKKEAEHFMERYHLMGHAGAAYCYGIVHEKQLVAVATFSKGRKMDRLPQGMLSHELVRLASLPGITVTGSLSRLLLQFYRDLLPGDVMTYVDPLLGDKLSFEKNGFVFHGMTKPINLFVEQAKHIRYYKDPGNLNNLVAFQTIGNYKLVKTF